MSPMLPLHEVLKPVRMMPFRRFRKSFTGPPKTCADAYHALSMEIRSSSRYLRSLEGEWEEENKDRLKHKTQPDSPGYIYFFQTITGWYKYGRCTNWDKHNRLSVPRPGDKKQSYRKAGYTGANTPGRIFLVRRVPRVKEAEYFLGRFLKNLEGNPYFVASGNEWLLKEQTAVGQYHRKRLRGLKRPMATAEGRRSPSSTVPGPPSERT